ncbi:MAG TPA: cbb3-type cytochrome oxidase assembly protein CcoS [Bacteroidetes bacterium]|nr:cbb3-type cytochrome oxidase assembly protein CcoS [Bacteroidota bacterium]
MNIMYLLIGCSILIAIGFLGAFLWSVRSGQYDDTDTPAMRILFDNLPIKDEKETLGDGKPKNL